MFTLQKPLKRDIKKLHLRQETLFADTSLLNLTPKSKKKLKQTNRIKQQQENNKNKNNIWVFLVKHVTISCYVRYKDKMSSIST